MSGEIMIMNNMIFKHYSYRETKTFLKIEDEIIVNSINKEEIFIVTNSKYEVPRHFHFNEVQDTIYLCRKSDSGIEKIQWSINLKSVQFRLIIDEDEIIKLENTYKKYLRNKKFEKIK